MLDRRSSPTATGDGFVSYDTVTAGRSARRLSQSVDALAEPLSQVAAKRAELMARPKVSRRGFLTRRRWRGVSARRQAGRSRRSPRPIPARRPRPRSAARGSPFYGPHQAGIVTPAQDRLHFAAFDVVEGARREDLRDAAAAPGPPPHAA